VDDCQIKYTTNLGEKKTKKKHLSGCGKDQHFMVDGINIGRGLKMGHGTGGRPYEGP
jgi:hypothetical protein